MSTLPLGWATDLAVLRLGGSSVEHHGDHWVVRSPDNPSYHWGNLLLAERAVEDGAGWAVAFERAFPEAAHRSIALVSRPADVSAWTERAYEVGHDVVLAADVPPPVTDLPADYEVRPLGDDDWDASLDLRLDSFGEDETFERAATDTRRRMVAEGHTRWLGAFAGDSLAAELGIVDVGDGVARYQSVLTAPDHRRRGLTRHLLAEAAAWAASRGARRWVIVAEPGSDAERLYRAAGFSPVAESWSASRLPRVPETASLGD